MTNFPEDLQCSIYDSSNCLAWPSLVNLLNCTGQLIHPSSSWPLWIIVCWTKGVRYGYCYCERESVCVFLVNGRHKPWGEKKKWLWSSSLFTQGVISPFRDQTCVYTKHTVPRQGMQSRLFVLQRLVCSRARDCASTNEREREREFDHVLCEELCVWRCARVWLLTPDLNLD